MGGYYGGYRNSKKSKSWRILLKIATKLGIDEEYIEQYGKYKAKISCKLYEKIRKKKITEN